MKFRILPVEEYHIAKAHFTLNLYETGVMGSEGTKKGIGDAIRKKQEKNNEDNRDFITIV